MWCTFPNIVPVAAFYLFLLCPTARVDIPMPMTTYDHTVIFSISPLSNDTPPPAPARPYPSQPKQVGDHTIHLDYDGTNALYLPTTSEAVDSAVRSKYDDTIDADPTLPPVWSPDTLGARTSIQISGDSVPTVLSVSAPGTVNGTTYGVGEEIDLEVVFSTRVFVKDSHSLPYVLVEAGEGTSGEAQVGKMGYSLETACCFVVAVYVARCAEVFLYLMHATTAKQCENVRREKKTASVDEQNNFLLILVRDKLSTGAPRRVE